VPERLTHEAMSWELGGIYYSNWIGHSTHKRVHGPSQEIAMAIYNPVDVN